MWWNLSELFFHLISMTLTCSNGVLRRCFYHVLRLLRTFIHGCRISLLKSDVKRRTCYEIFLSNPVFFLYTRRQIRLHNRPKGNAWLSSCLYNIETKTTFRDDLLTSNCTGGLKQHVGFSLLVLVMLSLVLSFL